MAFPPNEPKEHTMDHALPQGLSGLPYSLKELIVIFLREKYTLPFELLLYFHLIFKNFKSDIEAPILYCVELNTFTFLSPKN